MGILALATMDKLIRKAGAKRVSNSAKEELKRVLEKFAEEIAVKSVKLAKHGGRTTVKKVDIELATKT